MIELSNKLALTIPTTSSDTLSAISDLPSLIYFITNLVIYLGIGVVLIMLAAGFISFVTSGGDKIKTEQAQRWVTYAVLGGIGLFAVYAIRTVILNTLGVTAPY